MALLRTLCWALIFILRLRFPPGSSLASIFKIYLFNFATRAATPQHHMPITVGPCHLTHLVNLPCERKAEYPKKTHDFAQSVDILFSHEDLVLSKLCFSYRRYNSPAGTEIFRLRRAECSFNFSS